MNTGYKFICFFKKKVTRAVYLKKGYLFIFLFLGLIHVKAQQMDSAWKVICSKVAGEFIDNYNKQDYSLMRKDFSKLMKVFTKEEKLRDLYAEKFAKQGALKIVGVKYPSYFKILLSMSCEKDPNEFVYISFLINPENYKIEGFSNEQHDIVYPKIKSTTSIKEIAEAYLNFKENKGLGMIVGTLENGKKEYYGFGSIKKESGILPDSLSLFQIGSITKVFTSLLFAHSINTNLVDPNTSINKFLPDSIPKLAYKGKSPVITALANHSSGLARDVDDALVDSITGDPFCNYTKRNLYNYLKKNNLAHKPGKDHLEYSNIGVGLLGLLLNEIYGCESKNAGNTDCYNDLLQKVICNELNMRYTGTKVKDNIPKVTSYFRGEEISDMKFTDVFVAAGGIYSNATDMLRFSEAYLKPESNKLKEDIQLTLKPSIQFKGKKAVGLAWFIEPIEVAKSSYTKIYHPGNTMGTSSILILLPERNIAVFVSANSSIPVNELGDEIVKKMLKN